MWRGYLERSWRGSRVDEDAVQRAGLMACKYGFDFGLVGGIETHHKRHSHT